MTKRLLPQQVRDAAVYYFLFSDRSSRKAFRNAYRPANTGLVRLRLRALKGRSIEIRPGTDDPWAVRDAFTWSDPLPPRGMCPRVILDLGANIGTSTALLAARFPDAHIVAVEPDSNNAELCRRNVAAWADRCDVIEAAAWYQDGKVHIAGSSTSTYSVQNDGLEVDAISLNSLLETFGPFDYVKVDIEGAERSLLAQNTMWVNSVRCMNVEVHAPYSIEECASDLARLGFKVSLRAAPRQPHVIGTR
jgi:FkbM family methyltransferase